MAKNNFGKVQKEQYNKLTEKAKKDVEDGYGVVVCDLESAATICKFNMENFRPTDEQLEVLAEVLLPDIIGFYKDEKTKRCLKNGKFNKTKRKTDYIGTDRSVRGGLFIPLFLLKRNNCLLVFAKYIDIVPEM